MTLLLKVVESTFTWAVDWLLRSGEMEIGFNVNYLLDALAAIDGGEVELGLSDSNSSCLLSATGVVILCDLHIFATQQC